MPNWIGNFYILVNYPNDNIKHHSQIVSPLAGSNRE